MQRRIILALSLVVSYASFAQAQPSRRYYTDAKIQIMRANLDKYEWARKQRSEIIAKADRWAAYDDERLRSLVIPPQVPRAYDVSNQGCPVHGTKIYEKGLYSWGYDFDKFSNMAAK